MDHAGVPPRHLAYALLKQITDGFSDERILGSGTYGKVYLGVNKDGTKIAVKVLYDTPSLDDNYKQFDKEFHNLTCLQHPNIVRLVGYCYETHRECLPYDGKMVLADVTKRALCFEYMHNGSLDNHLSDESNGHDWHTRYAIIKGICKGLKHLHEELQPPILHLDLKPANVLLDENMVPKLADFGLSRLFLEERTQITRSYIGTFGYLPPEFINQSVISNKFDIFSLGVVIIKILAGSTGYSKCGEMSSNKFIELVHENWRSKLQEKSLYALESYSEQVKRCIEIAIGCVDADRHQRPSIGDIINKLNEAETMIHEHSQLPDTLGNDPVSLMAQKKNSMDHGSVISGSMAFHVLEEMTDDFSELRKLGGGFNGKVYMGVTKDGEKIAVKMFHNKSKLDDYQFEIEYLNLACLQHHNIVRLVGYCYETRPQFAMNNERKFIPVPWTTNMVLCLEYLHNGSLEECLSGKLSELDWHTRYAIIKGICMGLKYLHEELESPMFHLNLKPANILLDENMVPKLADFGMSRLFGRTHAAVISTTGTHEYLAPEYIRQHVVSNKVDIFSLGVIIIKMMTRYTQSAERISSQEFIELVHRNWRNRLLAASVDALESHCKQVKRCIEIALSCVEVNHHKRPTIGDIINELNETETISQFPDALRNDPGSSMDQESYRTHLQEVEEKRAREKLSEFENLFGEVVDNYKLDQMAKYMGKPKTLEDRAREAWDLVDVDDKNTKASRYIAGLKSMYGNGRSTMCLVYNATGDTLYHVVQHEWSGHIDRAPYPALIGNGQWAAFHHVAQAGEPDSVAAIVYRGKNKDGQEQDYLLAWRTPSSPWKRNKVYCDIRSVDFFEERWVDVHRNLINSGYHWNAEYGGCYIEAKIDGGNSPKFTARIANWGQHRRIPI